MRVEDPLAGRDYRPAMPGDEPDFWEGPKWDLLGFIAQYLWAIGIVLAAAASLYAVLSYNQLDITDGSEEKVEATSFSSTAPESSSGASYDVEDDAPPL